MSVLRISEIFGPTVQGEGALIGKPTVFVRTGGCDFRCSWCDTLHAVLPAYRHDWTPMTPEEILARVGELTGGVPVLITLSGGNPAIQPIGRLIALGKERNHRFAMETQGSVADVCFAELDWLVLSPQAALLRHDDRLGRVRRLPRRRRRRSAHGPQGRRVRRCRL
jgi:7-carboxy-7-deazaguanine synthase